MPGVRTSPWFVTSCHNNENSTLSRRIFQDPQRELLSLSHHSVIEKLVVYVTKWIFNLSRNVQVSDVGCRSSRSACGCPAEFLGRLKHHNDLIRCFCCHFCCPAFVKQICFTNIGESGRSGSAFCLQKPLVLEKSLFFH